MVVPRGCPYSEALDLRCRGVVRRTVNAQGLTTGICGAKVSNEETDESIVNKYRQERENNEPCLYIYFFRYSFLIILTGMLNAYYHVAMIMKVYTQ